MLAIFWLGCSGEVDPCAAPLATPPTGRRVGGVATEDLAFDPYGHLVGSDYDDLLWSTRDGEVAILIPGVRTPAGMQFLDDDSLVVAAVTTGEVLRLYPGGGREALLTGLNWPNGVVIHPDGRVLVTELSGSRVWWVEPDGRASGVLAEVERPNGIAVDGRGDVWVGTMTGAGEIWRMDADGQGQEVVHSGVGAGDINGMAFDVCGGLVVADYEGHRIVRLDSDGSEQVLLDRTEWGTFLPAMRWGSGAGGWQADRLYVPELPEGTVWELDVGLRGL